MFAPIGIAPDSFATYAQVRFAHLLGLPIPKRPPPNLFMRPTEYDMPPQRGPTAKPAARPVSKAPACDRRLAAVIAAGHDRLRHHVRWRAAALDKHAGDDRALGAYHEAGHAVIARALGVAVDSVSADGAGHIVFRNVNQDRLAAAAVGLAGQAAEKRLLGWARDLSGTDQHHVDANIDGAGELWEVRSRVERLLDSHWPAVDALAEQLAYAGRLSASEVDRILRDAGLAF
jgi:hypothetical protein